MGTAEGSTILLVDDEPQILELFRQRLEDDYDVVTAESGEAALEAMNADVAAVLLDRRMPGLTGSEVLKRLRDAGYDQPVAMVTAVDPDFDVIEMGFDDYVVKPVGDEELVKLVESLVLRSRYDDVLREYFSLSSKVAALKASKSPSSLASNPEYTEAIDHLNEIKQEAKHSLDDAMDAGMLEELLWESFVHASEAGSVESDGGVEFY